MELCGACFWIFESGFLSRDIGGWLILFFQFSRKTDNSQKQRFERNSTIIKAL